MRIPMFWHKASERVDGCSWPLGAWGWSDESQEAAAEHARERLKAQADAVAAGKSLSRYDYRDGQRPLREEVLERPTPGSLITRNTYGSRILNTERVAFVDVDLAPVAPPPGFFARLFGATPGPSREQVVEEKIDLFRAALRTGGLSARVYETHSGLRLLLTDRLWNPASDETQALLRGLGCDPLYLALCRTQECFRARLTPKPWRCAQPAPPPPHRWPYADSTQTAAVKAWVERYEAACPPHATTRYITTLGGRDVAEDVHPLLEIHDARSGATSGLPLA